MDAKQIRLLIMMLLLLFVAGCISPDNTITIKDSEKLYNYKLVWNEEKKSYLFQYDPQPDRVIFVKAKLVWTETPFVRSLSFVNEIESFFELLDGESIPQKPLIKMIHLYYFEHQPPLKKGQIVDLLFDTKGNYIDIQLPPLD